MIVGESSSDSRIVGTNRPNANRESPKLRAMRAEPRMASERGLMRNIFGDGPKGRVMCQGLLPLSMVHQGAFGAMPVGYCGRYAKTVVCPRLFPQSLKTAAPTKKDNSAQAEMSTEVPMASARSIALPLAMLMTVQYARIRITHTWGQVLQ